MGAQQEPVGNIFEMFFGGIGKDWGAKKKRAKNPKNHPFLKGTSSSFHLHVLGFQPLVYGKFKFYKEQHHWILRSGYVNLNLAQNI